MKDEVWKYLRWLKTWAKLDGFDKRWVKKEIKESTKILVDREVPCGD